MAGCDESATILYQRRRTVELKYGSPAAGDPKSTRHSAVGRSPMWPCCAAPSCGGAERSWTFVNGPLNVDDCGAPYERESPGHAPKVPLARRQARGFRGGRDARTAEPAECGAVRSPGV
jgi:hypothetical protein